MVIWGHVLRYRGLTSAMLPEFWARLELSLLVLQVLHGAQVGNLQGQWRGSEIQGPRSGGARRPALRGRRDLERVLQPIRHKVLLLHLGGSQYVRVEENLDCCLQVQREILRPQVGPSLGRSATFPRIAFPVQVFFLPW